MTSHLIFPLSIGTLMGRCCQEKGFISNPMTWTIVPDESKTLASIELESFEILKTPMLVLRFWLTEIPTLDSGALLLTMRGMIPLTTVVLKRPFGESV